MAINFPATAGQATDGTFTYTVAGITYAWNGSSWAAAGAGASATNRSLFSVATNSPSGGGSLVYSTANGAFTYTPPNLSGFLTAETDTLASVTARGATTNDTVTFNSLLNVSNITLQTNNTLDIIDSTSTGGIDIQSNYSVQIGQNGFPNQDYARFSGAYCEFYTSGTKRLETTSTGATVTGALTAGGLTYPTSNGTSGQVLSSDGAGNVTWATPAGLRTTAQVTVNIANEAISNTSFTTPKTYALLKVSTSHAAWVTLYSDTGSRTADASRQINVDPLPGSGVLSEVITTGNQVQLITPGTICFNSAGTGTTYAKIVNKSGSTANVTVTLTYVVLES
jgi:hypothetical protein